LIKLNTDAPGYNHAARACDKDKVTISGSADNENKNWQQTPNLRTELWEPGDGPVHP